MPRKPKPDKHIEEKVMDGAGKVLDFFQPDPPDRDITDFVGDQTTKNRKPPFDLI